MSSLSSDCMLGDYSYLVAFIYRSATRMCTLSGSQSARLFLSLRQPQRSLFLPTSIFYTGRTSPRAKGLSGVERDIRKRLKRICLAWLCIQRFEVFLSRWSSKPRKQSRLRAPFYIQSCAYGDEHRVIPVLYVFWHENSFGACEGDRAEGF